MHINSIAGFRLETVVIKFVEILLTKHQWDSINARLNGHTLGSALTSTTHLEECSKDSENEYNYSDNTPDHSSFMTNPKHITPKLMQRFVLILL